MINDKILKDMKKRYDKEYGRLWIITIIWLVSIISMAYYSNVVMITFIFLTAILSLMLGLKAGQVKHIKKLLGR